MIKLARYTIDANWRPVKIDARVPMPEELDLSYLKGIDKLLPGETEMPKDEVMYMQYSTH